MMIALKVEPADDGARVDVFLAKHTDLSRSRLQALIRQGGVLVKGEAVKPSHIVRAGDAIELEEPPPVEARARPEAIPLDVIFEDNHLIVVNKSRGMVVHPGVGVYSGTLVNALLSYCRDLSGVGGEARPGIVHRLDRYTSGIIIAAKSDLAHASLMHQFASRTVKKEYLALVCGSPALSEGTVDAPVGRHPVHRERMAVIDDGRSAVTSWQVEEYFGEYSLVRCFPLTGRTHQIRVHLASIGHPVVGDSVYGKKPHPFSIRGQALHAAVLAFAHPVTGEELRFEAPLPEDMAGILEQLRLKKGSQS
jgi:23S rRNA pseudouridine1911/1915/1917 synthase